MESVIIRGDSVAVRIAMKMNVEGKKERGKLKKRWRDRIENDMKTYGVS